MAEAKVVREGVGRRDGDGHCDNHEKNTTDIAKLKGYVAVIALFGMPVIGYYVGSIDKQMEKSSEKQDKLIIMLTQTKSTADYTAEELAELKVAVKSIADVQASRGSK